MKKNIGILILASIVLISFYLVASSVFSDKNIIQKSLPDFAMADISGNIYSDKQINSQKSTIVAIVSADCGTCNALLDNFSDKKTDLTNSIIITFDRESALKIRDRVVNKNIKILIGDYAYLKKKFGKSTISSVFIYNPQKKLIKHYVGSISPMKFI